MGRFGNQVFQYAFLRLAANAAGARVECSPWPGQAIFGHDDPPVTTSLAPLIEADPDAPTIFDAISELVPYVEGLTNQRAGRIGPEALSVASAPGDLIGFFQFHTRHYSPLREQFRSLFQPRPALSEWLDDPLRLLRSRGRTIVAIHLRSGDYKWLPQLGFTLSAPPRWWLDWLDVNWSSLDNPVLYLCSDDIAGVKKSFRKYSPFTEADLEVRPPDEIEKAGAGFYRDHNLMSHADILGVSNSTFSFSAAMLNTRARTFLRPTWNFSAPLAEFDPWDAQPLLYQTEGPKRFLRTYREMVRSAWQTRGAMGVASLVFAQQPAGMLAVATGRAGLVVNNWRIRRRR
jgi:hypothetical protein